MSALLNIFYKHIQSNPKQVAYLLQTEEGNELPLTYEELWNQTRKVAQHLYSKKSQSENALLIFNPGFEFIYTLFGCFYSNTTAIPISIPRPKTKALFQHFIDHAAPKFILTTSDLTDRIRALLNEDDLHLEIIEIDQLPNVAGPFTPQAPINPLAIIQYTSGSTAFPKGVMITFDNLHHNLNAIKNHFGLHEESVCFSWLPHYHDMGLVDGLLTPIFNQCRAIICSPYRIVSNPIRWLQAIDNFKVTHTGGPNFILDLCVDKISKQDADRLNLRSLSHIYVSAEPVRKKTLTRFATHFSAAGFRSTLFTPGYGLAEATLMVTCKERNKSLRYRTLTTETSLQEYVSLGKPIEGVQLKIINPETGEQRNEGESGEIVLSGPTIAKGYYRDKASTSKATIDLMEDGSAIPYLRTGDVGLLSDGELFVIGRLKDTLIIHGVQYQAEDLEYVASLSHPDIHQSSCAAFSVDIQNLEHTVIIAEIRRSKWKQGDKNLIKNSIREAVFDNFGIGIHAIVLVPQGSIPKTTSGKLRRGDCRMKYLHQLFTDYE